MAKIHDTIRDLPAQQRARAKRLAIAEQARKGRHTRSQYDIEIVDVQPIENGVEVFARAWNEKGQIGFGKDGTVDIERFIKPTSSGGNGPNGHLTHIAVPDPNGDIEVEEDVFDEVTGEKKGTHTVRFREDPKENLLIWLEHTISVMQNKHGDENIVVGKRGNTTSTFNPDGGDGVGDTHDRSMQAENASWDTAHDASSADGIFTDNGTQYVRAQLSGAPAYNLVRYLATFDTSTIPSTDTTTSATFSVFETNHGVDDNDAQAYISVVQLQDVASDNSANTADWNQIGDAIDNPTEGVDSGDRLALSSVTEDAYNDLPFNATGREWIAKNGESSPAGNTAGITYLGLREGHDIEDSPVASGQNFIFFASANNADSNKHPKFVVEHEAGGTTVEPSAVTASFTIPAPTVTGAATVSPSPVTSSFTVPSPTVTGAATVSPDPVTASFTVPSPTVGASVIASPDPVTASFTIPAPTVTGGTKFTVGPVTGTFNIPSPTVTGGALVSVSPVTATFSIPSPTVRGAIWENVSKNTATLSNVAKNTATLTNIKKS